MTQVGRNASPHELLSHHSVGALCAVLIGLFYLVTIREGHDWGDDFSMYIHHARNIADGAPYAETPYIYNPHNPFIGPRTYPPGFPLLLAPVVKLSGLDMRPMKVLVVGFFVGSLLGMLRLFRDGLSPAYLAALVLVVGLNPFFWEFKDQVLSDIPFLFFGLMSLHLFRQADEPNASGRRRATLAVLAGAAAYAAYATRALAIVLAPCFIGHDLIRHRRIGMNAALASCVLIGLAGAQHVFWLHDTSYFDQFSGLAAAARRNVVAYPRSLSELWENGYSSVLRKGAFLASGTVAAFGYVRSLHSGAALLHLFPWLYLVPVLGWPSFQGTRFLIPLVPFYFYFCLLGIRALDAVVERRRGKRNAVLIAFLGATLLSYAARYSTLQFGPLAEGIGKPESVELFKFVTAATDPSDVFVFSRPRALALFTGRRASGSHRAAHPCELWQYMREIHASYVITGPESDNSNPDMFNADAEYLGRFVRLFRDDFRPVMTNRDLAVYRIGGDPCRAELQITR